MPDTVRSRSRSNTLHRLLDEMVLAGAGVLFVILGIFSIVPLTSIASVGIGAFLFYTAYSVYRGKHLRESAPNFDVADPPSDDEPYRHAPAVAVDEEEEAWVREREEEKDRWEEPFVPVTAQPQPQRRSEPVKETVTVPAAEYFEEIQRPAMGHAEPQSEFNTLLLKALQIVKEVCFAHSVTFFWVKTETRQLVLEAKVSDSDAFTPERKLPLGSDLISRIGVNGQPQVVNNILPETERDILCYYKNLQEIRSFIGVPVFYAGDQSRQPIAVLAADSKAPDAYGEETFAILSHVSRLISSMLISYTEKYDLFADVKLIEAGMKLKKRTADHPPITAVVNALSEELENLVPWESITVVLYDDAQREWAVASVRVRGNDRFVSPKQLVDVENSVVGRCIRSNSVQSVDLTKNKEMLFNDHERSSDVLKNGTMVVVPVSSGGKGFGAVAVTERRPNAYSKKDVAAMQFLASIIAPEFEITELNTILNEHIAQDELTGTLTRKFFAARLEEELYRATEREEDLSLVFVTVHNLPDVQQRYGDDGRDAALVHVARHLRASVRPYDAVGRYDATTFTVALADTIANDAYLWAEKLRTAIAGSIVAAGRKSFSITVTIGISGASAKMTGAELVKNASHVLELAKKAGGNIVRVF
ncbi:MAG: diguanylate cyclase [Bacteroidetes bacterium]|nr:diguanylate cyclase [Bacteroidota bacterium]